MGFLTFDPNRVLLLGRSLRDLSERLDAHSLEGANDDVTRLVRAARQLVDEQISRVETSLGVIQSMDERPRRTCVSIDWAISSYSTWANEARHWWTQATTRTSTRSDEILREFECANDPQAAGRLIDSLPNLELLILGTADLSLVESVWKAATDPSATSPFVAGMRIGRLLDVIFDEREWERGLATGSIDPVERARRNVELRQLAARISAPWQLYFSRTDAPWSWSGAQGSRRLHQLSELESASDTLVQGLGRALQLSLDGLPDDPSTRLGLIDSVAGAVGTSLEVRRMSEADRARATSDLDTLRNILGALSLDGPWPISLIVDAGARWVGDYFDTSDARLRQATLESLVQREIFASLAVLAVFTAAIKRAHPQHRDESPAGMRAPKQTAADLAAELRYTYQSIDNAAGRGLSLAQLTSPR